MWVCGQITNRDLLHATPGCVRTTINDGLSGVYLDDDFPPAVELAKLVRHRAQLALAGHLVLSLQVIQGAVDPADLAMWPALDPMTPAQAFQCRHRYVHRLQTPNGQRGGQKVGGCPT